MAQLPLESFPNADSEVPKDITAAKCDLEMILWVEANFAWPVVCDPEFLEVATTPHKSWIESCTDLAIHAGQLDVLQHFRDDILNDHDVERTGRLFAEAAKHGHFDILKWLCDWDRQFLSSAMNGAAKGNQLEIVKWLHGQLQLRVQGIAEGTIQEEWGDVTKIYSIDKAAKHGSFELVQWLLAHRSNDGANKAIEHATLRGKFDMVKCLHNAKTAAGCKGDGAVKQAIRGGHFETMKWMLENCSECSKGLSSFATDLTWLYYMVTFQS